MHHNLEVASENNELGCLPESELSKADKESKFESLSTLVSYLIKSGEDAARVLDAAQELTIKEVHPGLSWVR